MALKLLSGTSNIGLAKAIAHGLGLELGNLKIERFPDGEISVEVEDIGGQEVYVIQSTSPPVADNLLELLLSVDALRRAGTEKVTAVIPYFGYARQDRRPRGNEPVSARVVANLLEGIGLSRIIALDIHNPSIEGFFNIPFEDITAAPLLAEACKKDCADIVVAPDLGAVKLAEAYTTPLGLPLAIVHKERLTGADVKVHTIAGDIKGKKPLIVDDMISTAGTIEAASKALLDAGCLPEISMAVSHGLLVGPAIKRLKGLPLRRLYLTNTVSAGPFPELPVEVVDVGPLLGKVIERLYGGHSIADLRAHT